MGPDGAMREAKRSWQSPHPPRRGLQGRNGSLPRRSDMPHSYALHGQRVRDLAQLECPRTRQCDPSAQVFHTARTRPPLGRYDAPAAGNSVRANRKRKSSDIETFEAFPASPPCPDFGASSPSSAGSALSIANATSPNSAA